MASGWVPHVNVAHPTDAKRILCHMTGHPPCCCFVCVVPSVIWVGYALDGPVLHRLDSASVQVFRLCHPIPSQNCALFHDQFRGRIGYEEQFRPGTVLGYLGRKSQQGDPEQFFDGV